MIALYRYTKRKRAEKAQRAVQPQEVPLSNSPSASPNANGLHEATINTESQPKSETTSWTWKLLLMTALIFPVFLETLDYTGMRLTK